MRHRLMVLLAVAVGATPAAAQQGHHEGHAMPMMQHQDMAQCAGMMGGATPGMLLQQKDQLGLTADQVTKLEALRAQGQETHMQAAMQAQLAAAAALEGASPDLQAYEAKLREAANHMVQAHLAMARLGIQAKAILTPEQQSKLRSLRDHGGAHMEMGAAHAGMRAMMCPMMGGAHGAAGGHGH